MIYTKRRSIALLTIALCGIISPISARRQRFQPSVESLHVMTVSKTEEAATTTEQSLVKAIHSNRMPSRAIIAVDSDQYAYQRGIAPAVKEADYIYLMSRGYARRKKISGPEKDDHFIQKGGCVIHTRDRIAQNVIHLGPKSIAVTFDYKDDYVNFGQKRDISCLSFVYEEIKKANPKAHIIIVGECLGAKVALELATRYPLEKSTLILESPFFKASDLWEMMSENYVGWSASSIILKWGMRAFAHYDEKQDDLPERFTNIQPQVYIFACHRNGDPLLHDDHFSQHTASLTNHLNDHVTAYRFDDSEQRHSSTFRHKEARKAVNTFYKAHGLPYCQTLAH